MKRASVFSIAVLSLSIGLTGAASAATAPPTVVTGVANAVQPTSVVVHGIVNPRGTATTWYFQYGPSSTSGFPLKTGTSSAGGGSGDVKVAKTLSGLSPSTSYDYRIVASNSHGTVVGSIGFFNTSAAPSVLTSPASAIGSTSATLNGAIAPQGLATDWYFLYGTTTSYGSRTTQKVLTASPNTTLVSAGIANLVAHTTYHFRLVAVSSAGTTRGSDVSFTTGLAVTLNSSVATITEKQFVTLSGTLASGQPNVQVTILAQRFDQPSLQTLSVVMTGAGGGWTYTAQPLARTTYQATVSNGSSSAIVVGVRPIVTLSEVSGQQLTTKVTGVYSFAHHVLQLQRLVGNTWVTWKHVQLNRRGSATFATALPKGRTAIRMAIGPFIDSIDQAGPGYLAGFSRTITYVNR